MSLTVHHLQVSQSERIVWLCEELGIDYTLKIHQRDPIYSPQSIKDLNPLGQAPVIQDGDVTLAESAACVEYIIHKYGNGRLALPPAHKDYADFLYWFHFANGGMQPRLGQIMALKWGEAPPEAAYGKRVREQFQHILRFVDDRLKTNDYLAGSEFTAADIMSVFTLTTMRTFFPVDLSEFANILAYLKRMTSRDGYKRFIAKADPNLGLMIDGRPPEQFIDKLKGTGKL